MNVLRVAALGIAIATPTLGMAELPFDKRGFGQIEAILDYCAQANAQSAEKF